MKLQGRPIGDWVAEVEPEGGFGGKNSGLYVLVPSAPRFVTEVAELMLHDPSQAQREKAAYALSVMAYRNPEAPEVRSTPRPGGVCGGLGVGERFGMRRCSAGLEAVAWC